MGVEVALVASIVSAVASVVSLAMTLTMDQPETGGDNGTSVDRKGQNSPKIVPFGDCRVPSVKVWTNVSNHNTKYLAQVHSFGFGKLRKINEIYIDGNPYFTSWTKSKPDTWFGIESSANFPNAMLGYRLGNPTEQAYSQLFEHSDGEWNAECRGDRTATLSMLIERWINKESDNNIRIMSDRFKVEAQVEGIAVIDPRFDHALAGVDDWTKRIWMSPDESRWCYRNPANVLLTYLVDKEYGMSIPIDAIDIKSFIDLANYCDEMGYRFDGYVDQNQTFGKILIDMCTAFDGIAYVEDGLVKVKADRLASPVCDINEDDCINSPKLSNSNDSNYFNIINVEFTNVSSEYSVDKFVLPADITTNETIIRDGFEKIKDIKLPYTSDDRDCRFIKAYANRKMKQIKHQQTIEFELDNTRKKLGIYDVFTFSNNAYKLNKKKFRVTKIATTLDDKTMISKVTAQEYNTSIYDESDYEEGNTSTPVKPPSMQILSPVSLKFEQTGYTTTGSGRLSWTSRYQKEHKTVVEYKLASATEWYRLGEVKNSHYDFNALAADKYDFRVMTMNFMGSTSNWATLEDVTVKGGVKLPVITGAKATFDSTDCLLSWDDMKLVKLETNGLPMSDGINTVNDVFSHYEIQVYKGNNQVYADTLSSTTNEFTYSLNLNRRTTANRDLQFKLLVVARDGSTSKEAVLNAFNDQMYQPSGVQVSGMLTDLTVSWDHPEEVDYQATEIHISADSNFTPSVDTLVKTSTTSFVSMAGEYSGVHFCRVGHYDVFGTDEMAYTNEISFTMQSIDDLLDDSPLFDSTVSDLNDAIQNGIGDLTNDFNQQIGTVTDKITANANSIKTINTTLGNHNASINANASAIESNAGNLAEYKTEVQAKFEDTDAKITSNQKAIATANEAITQVNTSLTAEINKNKANIASNSTAISDNEKTIAQVNTSLTAEINKNKASINSNSTAISDNEKTIAQVSQTVGSNYNDLNGKINTNITSISNANKSINSLTNTVTANYGELKGSIQSTNQVIAGVDGKVEALTQIKHDVNGKVSGLIMGNNGTTSTFDVIADKFRISSKAGDQAVFQVDTGTGKVIIKDALIGTIHANKIQSGTITGGHISAGTKIFVGSGNNSASLDGGSPDWRIYAGHSTGANSPFRVHQNGHMVATNAYIQGEVRADRGYFKGTLSVGTAGHDVHGNLIRRDTMVIENNAIVCYDAHGNERVRLGKL